MKTYKLWIDGTWQSPATDEWLDTYNPYSGEVWARIPLGSRIDVDAAVQAASRAFREGDWSQMTATDRGRHLVRLADHLMEYADYLGEIEARDNGKLYSEAVSQCQYLTEWFRYYGGLADKIEGSVPPIDKPNVLNFTRYEPFGVCACITPWNSPLLQLAWKVAPALAAGNTVVVKPSEYTSASSLEFAEIAQDSGIPPGVINVVTGLGHDVGEALTTHKSVRKIAFTGSERGGAAVNMATASDFKHVTLELGGKSPNIVFADANKDQAVSGVVSGIFAASGQTCIAGSRLLLEESIYDEFLTRLIDVAGQTRLGDPMDLETDVGPITTEAQFRRILEYIEIAKSEGANCLLGGESLRLEGAKGYFVKPTIFTNVTPDMRIAQEEVFGPVLAVMRFRSDEEALQIANSVNFGLAAGVWTENIRRAIMMSERLEAGTVWVNTYRTASFMTPFGGYKASGLGRENGVEAIKEYMQVKSVWLSTSTEVKNPYGG